MINVLIILLFTGVQWLTGFGFLTLIKLRVKPALFLPLCILLGLAIFSLVPFLLELCFIQISAWRVFLLIGVICLLLNCRIKTGVQLLREMLAGVPFRIRLYEIPFLLITAFIIFVSVWRCFYYPPTPADANSGPEVIAEYTLRENTMINSVFDVEPSGNTLKPPFIACLQIIYKYAGFPFGQIWLSSVFICFIIILYHLLARKLHRVLAGVLILFFLAIPEMYAYTFMVLFDYSNAVFFFLSVYFLIYYFEKGGGNHLLLSGLLLGIATYIRPETLVLSGWLAVAVMWHCVKEKKDWVSMIKETMVFAAPTVVFYIASVIVYINLYIPVNYSIANQVNPHIGNLPLLLGRFWETNKTLIFSTWGIDAYGYFFFLFMALFLAELLVARKFNRAARNYLYAILSVYITFPVLSHALPGLSIENSVKRAFFKLFPLMLLYAGNNSLLQKLSAWLTQWEERPDRQPDAVQ
jgi:hypothetical protein